MSELATAFALVGAPGRESAAEIEAEANFVVPSPSLPGDDVLMSHPAFKRTPDAMWPYLDSTGKSFLLIICRWNPPAANKEIRQLTPRASGWTWKGHPDPRPLYGLDILAARQDAPVLVCEGEKAAEAARPLAPDHVVITWPGGAQAVGKADWHPLAGRRVTLWPDADEPGRKAMLKVRDLLGSIAASVTIVDLDPVRAALGGTLPPKWDLADAPADWTPAIVADLLARGTEAPSQPMVACGASVQREAERYLGKTLEETEESHAAILCGIITMMQSKGLAVDALGNFRDAKSWSRVSCDPVAFAEDLAFALRRDGLRTSTDRIGETFRTVARDDAGRRRRDLTSRFLGRPASVAGETELRRWLRAVTGDEQDADIAALKHWLWLVKNRVAGRHGELHLMLVVFGSKQGSGKSIAVSKLCAPWQELFDPDLCIEAIVDERNAPHLANCAIGLWDELGGLAKADMERLKHRMTSPTVAYRPMRSNQRTENPMLMSFIATTNRSIGEMVKDATGMRRFFEIRAADSLDWGVVNGIDYEALWSAVSEDDAAPGVTFREAIEKAQAHLVWRDPVQRWIGDEDEAGWLSRIGRGGEALAAVDPKAGGVTGLLYSRFLAWCEEAGEKEMTRESMGRCLSAMGWEAFRLPRAQGQTPGWRRPVIEKVTLHTLNNPAHPGSETASAQGAQGAQGAALYNETTRRTVDL